MPPVLVVVMFSLMEVYMKFKGSLIRKEPIVQSRSWQLIIPAGWDNLEAIKERCRGIARNYYFIVHNYDKNELGEPVKPHWHLLVSFAAARQLGTMQNYFKEWGKFDEKKDIKENEDYETPKDGQVSDLESEQLLRPNSFERVYSLDGARKYLVHAEDPNKYQYSPLDVETNDKLFINLFLPKADEISTTKKMINSYRQLSLCNDFNEYLLLFEEFLYTMPNAQRMARIESLRRYYREYQVRGDSVCYDDGFDKVPPKDGFTELNANEVDLSKILNNDLPF